MSMAIHDQSLQKVWSVGLKPYHSAVDPVTIFCKPFASRKHPHPLPQQLHFLLHPLPPSAIPTRLSAKRHITKMSIARRSKGHPMAILWRHTQRRQTIQCYSILQVWTGLWWDGHLSQRPPLHHNQSHSCRPTFSPIRPQIRSYKATSCLLFATSADFRQLMRHFYIKSAFFSANFRYVRSLIVLKLPEFNGDCIYLLKRICKLLLNLYDTNISYYIYLQGICTPLRHHYNSSCEVYLSVCFKHLPFGWMFIGAGVGDFFVTSSTESRIDLFKRIMSPTYLIPYFGLPILLLVRTISPQVIASILLLYPFLISKSWAPVVCISKK